MRSLKNATDWLPAPISRGLRRIARGARRSLVPPETETFEQWAGARNPLQGRIYSDFTDFEQETLRLAPDAVASSEAVVALLRAVEHVVRHRIPGAFVECGVYAGGNLELMIRALQHLEIADRDIYAYDTFAGMPRPQAIDDQGLDGDLTTVWEAHRTAADGDAGSTWMRASLDTVRQRIRRLRYPDDRLRFVQGLVEQTIPAVIPDRIAILRLDTDFYSSTRHELVHLYPRLSAGGVLIIDDYGAMPGSRIATDEYAADHDISWFLHRVDAHVRLTIKP
jgi:O-methyltransferase